MKAKKIMPIAINVTKKRTSPRVQRITLSTDPDPDSTSADPELSSEKITIAWNGGEGHTQLEMRSVIIWTRGRPQAMGVLWIYRGNEKWTGIVTLIL
jgi:hypothetical protein